MKFKEASKHFLTIMIGLDSFVILYYWPWEAFSGLSAMPQFFKDVHLLWNVLETEKVSLIAYSG